MLRACILGMNTMLEQDVLSCLIDSMQDTGPDIHSDESS